MRSTAQIRSSRSCATPAVRVSAERFQRCRYLFETSRRDRGKVTSTVSLDRPAATTRRPVERTRKILAIALIRPATQPESPRVLRPACISIPSIHPRNPSKGSRTWSKKSRSPRRVAGSLFRRSKCCLKRSWIFGFRPLHLRAFGCLFASLRVIVRWPLDTETKRAIPRMPLPASDKIPSSSATTCPVGAAPYNSRAIRRRRPNGLTGYNVDKLETRKRCIGLDERDRV